MPRTKLAAMGFAARVRRPARRAGVVRRRAEDMVTDSTGCFRGELLRRRRLGAEDCRDAEEVGLDRKEL